MITLIIQKESEGVRTMVAVEVKTVYAFARWVPVDIDGKPAYRRLEQWVELHHRLEGTQRIPADRAWLARDPDDVMSGLAGRTYGLHQIDVWAPPVPKELEHLPVIDPADPRAGA